MAAAGDSRQMSERRLVNLGSGLLQQAAAEYEGIPPVCKLVVVLRQPGLLEPELLVELGCLLHHVFVT